jgi:hypothetical protein
MRKGSAALTSSAMGTALFGQFPGLGTVPEYSLNPTRAEWSLFPVVFAEHAK